MAAPAADDEDYEICNDNGFVYKRRRGLYPDDPPTSVLAAGPDPEAVRRRRRRLALRRLLEERRRELASWEALDAKVQALQTAPVPPPPQAPPASPGAAATDDPPASSSASPGAAATVVPSASSFLDDIHAHLELREEIVKKLAGLCKEFEALRSAHIAGLPVWGDPMELGSLQSPDAPPTSSHGLRNESSFKRDYLNRVNKVFQTWREVEGAIHALDVDGFQEAAGVSPATIQMIKERGEAMTEGLGHDPSTLSENREKKRVATPRGSRSVKKTKRSCQSTPNPASSRLRHTTRTATAKMHN